MKKITAAFALLLCLHAPAQTFTRVSLIGTTTNFISIPINTTAEIVGYQGTPAPGITADFGNGPVPIIYSPTQTFYPSGIILGPCTLKFYGYNTNYIGYYTVKIETVNTTPPPNVVSPAGTTATLAVETSTNLTTWQTITNAAFPKSETHRFFRTKLIVQ